MDFASTYALRSDDASYSPETMGMRLAYSYFARDKLLNFLEFSMLFRGYAHLFDIGTVLMAIRADLALGDAPLYVIVHIDEVQEIFYAGHAKAGTKGIIQNACVSSTLV
jgi:hypothetical protein